ncbi:MAG: ABC transporter ATP-binding protein, partial [Lachnospiraceae bacterium]|nr:ABC transporter ATP-binding protein [Lachnospiraceae bacterium]
MKKQNKALVLLRMLKLVKSLAGFMILAVLFGTLGFLTAEFIPILGGEAILIGLGQKTRISLNMLVPLLLS